MRQTLGTKILGVTDRYYLPFRLPSDIYFSDIYVKTSYNAGVVAYAAYIRVIVYENENDFVEVAGVPAGNPLILFEGWVRNTNAKDSVRIPINYIADLYNYSRYYITADYTNTYTGELTIDVLYSDVVTPSTAIYNPKDHQGYLYYTSKLTSTNAAGQMNLTIQMDGGEWLDLKEIHLYTGGGVADKEVYYKIGQNKFITWTVSDGDTIYLDKRFHNYLCVGPRDDIKINAALFAVGDTLTIRIYGTVRTADANTYTVGGNGTKSAEATIIS